MLNRNVQTGFILNHAPHLLIKAMNFAETDSDLLVKSARLVKADSSITHDSQAFRNYRVTGRLTKEIAEFCTGATISSPTAEDEDDLSNLGAWYLLRCGIAPFIQQPSDDELINDFYRYLDAYCELDRKFMTDAKSEGFESVHSSYLQIWMKINVTSKTVYNQDLLLSYAAGFVMYWAAAMELYLDLKYRRDNHYCLQLLLPTVTSSNRLCRTSEKFFSLLKSRWANRAHYDKKISNEMLYRNILAQQRKDPSINTSDPKHPAHDHVSPDTAAIKKHFDRYRNGGLITFKWFKENIAILSVPYSEEYVEPSLFIPFLQVNLFTMVQSELLNDKISPEEIVEAFSHYPKYKNLVKKRFHAFRATGELIP